MNNTLHTHIDPWFTQEKNTPITCIHPPLGYYIAGFVDGEGSFNTSFRRRDDYYLGWKITPVFNVSQKERTVLDLIKNTLKCGTIRFRKDGVWVYEVTDRNALRDIVIPFFDRFVLHSPWKKRDLQIFRDVCALVRLEKTLTQDTIRIPFARCVFYLIVNRPVVVENIPPLTSCSGAWSIPRKNVTRVFHNFHTQCARTVQGNQCNNISPKRETTFPVVAYNG